jgi:hypothetical protein
VPFEATQLVEALGQGRVGNLGEVGMEGLHDSFVSDEFGTLPDAATRAWCRETNRVDDLPAGAALEARGAWNAQEWLFLTLPWHPVRKGVSRCQGESESHLLITPASPACVRAHRPCGWFRMLAFRNPEEERRSYVRAGSSGMRRRHLPASRPPGPRPQAAGAIWRVAQLIPGHTPFPQKPGTPKAIQLPQSPPAQRGWFASGWLGSPGARADHAGATVVGGGLLPESPFDPRHGPRGDS